MPPLGEELDSALPPVQPLVGREGWRWAVFCFSFGNLHAANFVGCRIAEEGIRGPLAQIPSAIVSGPITNQPHIELLTCALAINMTLQSQFPVWEDGTAILLNGETEDLKRHMLERCGFDATHRVHQSIEGFQLGVFGSPNMEPLRGNVVEILEKRIIRDAPKPPSVRHRKEIHAYVEGMSQRAQRSVPMEKDTLAIYSPTEFGQLRKIGPALLSRDKTVAVVRTHKRKADDEEVNERPSKRPTIDQFFSRR